MAGELALKGPGYRALRETDRTVERRSEFTPAAPEAARLSAAQPSLASARLIGDVLPASTRLALAPPVSQHSTQAEKKRVPDWLEQQALRGGLRPSAGLPHDTWNGMSAEIYGVGAKDGSTRWVHLLQPGLHPATVAQAKQRFAWGEQRLALWQRLEAIAPQLHALGILQVAGAGSFFSSDYEKPGDIDLIAFAPTPPRRQAGRTWFAELNRQQGEHGVHVYWHAESILFPGGPSVLDSGLRHAPPNPRPSRFDLSFSAPRGPEVGLVLMNVSELGQLSR